MVSLRGRLFYHAMKFFFRWVIPANLPIERYRQTLTPSFSEPMPRDVHWEAGTLGTQAGEWIRPVHPSAEGVLLYLHGGAYVVGMTPVHRVLVGRLVQAIGCGAFLLDYRLAPEHPFPAALDDALSAYQALLKLGYAPSNILIAGDSAGGGLLAALLIRLRDAGEALPRAACLISPWLDCSLSGAHLAEQQSLDAYLRISDLTTMAKHYYGSHDPRNPLISPLFADLQALPPLLVMAGEYEILRDEAQAFAEQARQAGVEVTHSVWAGMIHAFPLFAGFVPEGKAAIQDMSRFFKKHLG